MSHGLLERTDLGPPLRFDLVASARFEPMLLSHYRRSKLAITVSLPIAEALHSNGVQAGTAAGGLVRP